MLKLEVFDPHGFICKFSIFQKILECLPQSIAHSSLRYPWDISCCTLLSWLWLWLWIIDPKTDGWNSQDHKSVVSIVATYSCEAWSSLPTDAEIEVRNLVPSMSSWFRHRSWISIYPRNWNWNWGLVWLVQSNAMAVPLSTIPTAPLTWPGKTATCSNVVYIAFTVWASDSCPDFHGCLGVPKYWNFPLLSGCHSFFSFRVHITLCLFLAFSGALFQARLSSRNDHRPGDREDTLPSVPKTSKAEMWMRYESHLWCTAVWEWIPQKISQNVNILFSMAKHSRPWNLQDSCRGSQDWPRVFCLDHSSTYCK